ncbi:MAG: tetratricopeptide repeat protein, partial [Phycisphaerae bacterium]
MKMKSEGKFAEALARATECVEMDSTLPEAWLYRASLYLRHDRLDEAMADLRRADELSPEDPATNCTI